MGEAAAAVAGAETDRSLRSALCRRPARRWIGRSPAALYVTSKPEWLNSKRVLGTVGQALSPGETCGAAASAPLPQDTATALMPAHVALAAGAGAVPIAGRALLGIAGAYVLRAITESHALPQQAGISAGILYSMLWLAWAARVGQARRVEAVLYSLTSALILAPLPWESTVRFHAVSTWPAAFVLLLLTVFGLVISWRRNLLFVATIATVTGVLSTATFLIGTYDLLPFTVLLLAIPVAVEISACLEHWLSERWVAAMAADLAVLLSAILTTRPGGLPEG